MKTMQLKKFQSEKDKRRKVYILQKNSNFELNPALTHSK